MEAHSRWYEDIAKEISLRKDWLSKKDSKKYKLDLLLRITGRVDGFSAACGECQMFQPEIKRLTQDLGNLVQMPKQGSKEERRRYFRTINNIIKHLQKHHKLVTEGYYMGIGIAIGTGIATAIGAALGNPGAGMGIGVAIGLAIGRYLDKKAKKEGRVI